jgi:hypothetical protein
LLGWLPVAWPKLQVTSIDRSSGAVSAEARSEFISRPGRSSGGLSPGATRTLTRVAPDEFASLSAIFLSQSGDSDSSLSVGTKPSAKFNHCSTAWMRVPPDVGLMTAM